MDNKLRIALIPAYMPDNSLIDMIYRLKNEGFEIVTVDDGSGNQCKKIFDNAQSSAHVLTHPENKGKGEALKTGLKFIKENYAKPYTVVTVDADGQHQFSDIVKVCDAAETHPGELVLGSRKIDKNAPIKSRIGNAITNVLFKLTTGGRLCDTQTGLRAFSDASVEKMIGSAGSRYEYEMNVLLDFSNQAIREIWIETVYINNNSATHFKAVKDSCRIYKVFFKYVFSPHKRS